MTKNQLTVFLTAIGWITLIFVAANRNALVAWLALTTIFGLGVGFGVLLILDFSKDLSPDEDALD